MKTDLQLPELSKEDWQRIMELLMRPKNMFHLNHWHVNHWSSRSNAFHIEKISDTSICFATQYGPPTTILYKLSEMNPELKIKIEIVMEESGDDQLYGYILHGGKHIVSYVTP